MDSFARPPIRARGKTKLPKRPPIHSHASLRHRIPIMTERAFRALAMYNTFSVPGKAGGRTLTGHLCPKASSIRAKKQHGYAKQGYPGLYLSVIDKITSTTRLTRCGPPLQRLAENIFNSSERIVTNISMPRKKKEIFFLTIGILGCSILDIEKRWGRGGYFYSIVTDRSPRFSVSSFSISSRLARAFSR